MQAARGGEVQDAAVGEAAAPGDRAKTNGNAETFEVFVRR